MVVSKQTNFFIYEDLWANAEFYFYGILVNAGVKDKTSIHLQTKDYGMITFSTEKDFLPELDDNALYTQFVARASGRQNITTGEIDMSSLQLLELTPYDPKYDEQYIGQLMKQATESWKDVDDVDQWISEIRGTNE